MSDEIVKEEETALAEAVRKAKEAEERLKTKEAEFERERKQLVKQALDSNGKVEVLVDKEDLLTKKAGLTKKLTSTNSTNLEIWEASVELRDIEIQLTGRDPYQPVTATDPHLGEKVALTMREILDEAGGDEAKFNYLMQDRIRDNPAYKNFK